MSDLDSAFASACERFDGQNFEQLSEMERVLVTIWGLEADVNNGGFDQYYFNGAGDLAFYADAALQRVGAHRMATIVRSANAMFGEQGPPRDRNARQVALFALTDGDENAFDELDREFQSYPDDLAGLLTAYLGARAVGR